MRIEKHKSLTTLNSFGIEASAANFLSLNNLSYLNQVFNLIQKHQQFLILGGGSNILFTQDFDGLVIHNDLKGIEILKETENYVWIKAMAGENWHEFVMHCVNHNFGGIENLSLIPGCVGAAPMQNIGAYGVELKDCFEVLEAYHIEKQEVHLFDAEDCEFGYRESVFKMELKGQYLILSITLRLNKEHVVNTSYGAIQGLLEKSNITKPTIKDVSDAVIEIRNSKLPDPKIIGNSGSFFKNPIIENEHLERIKADFQEIPNYPIDDKTTKVPAGWLIEQCGWKGKVVGNTGTYKNQALVIVNHGNATGKEVLTLSIEIQKSVQEKFAIQLQPEVNII